MSYPVPVTSLVNHDFVFSFKSVLFFMNLISSLGKVLAELETWGLIQLQTELKKCKQPSFLAFPSS